MNKFKKISKLFMTLTLVAVTFITLLSVSEPVYAWSGSGNGGNNTTDNGSGHWMMLEGRDGTSIAWDAFRAQTGGRSEASVRSTLLSNGNTNVDALIAGCRQSKYVWYLSSDYGGNSYNWAHQAKSSHKGTFHPVPSYNWSKFNSVFVRVDRAQWNSGRTVLVCSFNYVTPEADKVTKNTPVTEGDTKLADMNIANAVMSTTVKLEFPTEYPTWTAAQKKAYIDRYGGVEQVVTHYSVLEELNTLVKDIEKAQAGWATKDISAIRTEWNGFVARANALNAKVTSPENPLSTAQKNGLADYGGIFTIENRTRQFTIKGPTIGGKTTQTTTTCKQVNKDGEIQVVPGSCRTSAPVTLVNQTVKVKVSSTQSAEVLKNFWQILSVTCNKAGLDRIASELPGATLHRGNGGNGTVYTKLYNANEAKPFGQQGTLKWASTDSFFKQTSGCTYTCKPSKTGSEEFFAKDESGTSITKQEGVFTYFRDNETKNIIVNPWIIDTGSLSNDVVTSNVNRTIFNVNGNGLTEFEVTIPNATLKAMGKSFVSSGNGLIDKYGVRSSWVSEEGKNQEVQTSLGYDVTLKKYGIPNKVTGNKPAAVGGTYSRDGRVSVYCHVGNKNAITENAPIRNITPTGDKVGFNFVRAVGE